MKKKQELLDSEKERIGKIAQFYYKKSRIQQLRGFCLTVKHGTVSAAAAEMGLNPAAVSIQIKSLEEDVNTELFENVSGKLKLTMAGTMFYKKAIVVVSQIDNLFDDFILQHDKIYNNTLNISLNSFSLTKAIPIISKFCQERKGASINLSVDSQENSEQLLVDKKIDVFITNVEANSEINSELEFFNLLSYIPYLVLYKDHPLASKNSEDIVKEDLMSYDFSFCDTDVTMESLKSFIDSSKIKSKVNINNCGPYFHKLFIKNKMCCCIIFDIYLDSEDQEEFSLKNISHIFPCGQMGLFINRSSKPITKEFIKYYKENLSKV